MLHLLNVSSSSEVDVTVTCIQLGTIQLLKVKHAQRDMRVEVLSCVYTSDSLRLLHGFRVSL